MCKEHPLQAKETPGWEGGRGKQPRVAAEMGSNF